jgi:ADP-L-glycero-D-manno-heptose 6-epimerase
VRPIFRAMNVPERIEFIDMPEQLREKYQYCTCATMDRLRANGYETPITPLDEAVEDYVRNYLIPGRRLDPAHAPAGVK